MFAIFNTVEIKYYSHDANCHWVDNTSIAATFKTSQSAQNCINSTLKVQKSKLEVVKIDDEVTPLTKEEAEAAYNELQEAARVLGRIAGNIPAILNYYQGIQSEQDKLQEDLLHKFEFVSPGNIMFVKLGRLLKDCRIKRREAKNKVEYLIGISNATPYNLLKVDAYAEREKLMFLVLHQNFLIKKGSIIKWQ